VFKVFTETKVMADIAGGGHQKKKVLGNLLINAQARSLTLKRSKDTDKEKSTYTLPANVLHKRRASAYLILKRHPGENTCSSFDKKGRSLGVKRGG